MQILISANDGFPPPIEAIMWIFDDHFVDKKMLNKQLSETSSCSRNVIVMLWQRILKGRTAYLTEFRYPK